MFFLIASALFAVLAAGSALAAAGLAVPGEKGRTATASSAGYGENGPEKSDSPDGNNLGLPLGAPATGSSASSRPEPYPEQPGPEYLKLEQRSAGPPGEEELPIWRPWSIKDRVSVVGVESGSTREEIEIQLPDTYLLLMLQEGKKRFSVTWDLAEQYLPARDFIVSAGFNGYCPDEDAWYDLQPENVDFDDSRKTLIHYVLPGPIRDLNGRSRTFGGSTTVNLYFNEIELDFFSADQAFAPPGADHVYVERSEDGAAWEILREITAEDGCEIAVYPENSIPRHYRIRVVGGCQNGVSNEIILPVPPGNSELPDPDGSGGDDGSDGNEPSGDDSPGGEEPAGEGRPPAGSGEDSSSPPAGSGSTSIGGDDADIGGNRGGGTSVHKPDRNQTPGGARPPQSASSGEPPTGPGTEVADAENGAHLALPDGQTGSADSVEAAGAAAESEPGERSEKKARSGGQGKAEQKTGALQAGEAERETGGAQAGEAEQKAGALQAGKTEREAGAAPGRASAGGPAPASAAEPAGGAPRSGSGAEPMENGAVLSGEEASQHDPLSLPAQAVLGILAISGCGLFGMAVTYSARLRRFIRTLFRLYHPK